MTEGRPRRNSLGPVATSYDDLQSLPALLSVVNEAGPVRSGGAGQAVRAVFQAAEIVLVNLDALSAQLARQVAAHDHAGIRRGVTWQLAFARIWVELAWRAADLAGDAGAGELHLDVIDSPNWTALQRTERALADAIVEDLQREHSLFRDDETVRLGVLTYSMLQRVGTEYLQVGGSGPGYDAFVRPEALREVVHERALARPTVFMQFRAAHQVPEVLAVALNDHLESAITEIEAGDIPRGLRVLRRADRLADALVDTASILAENLTTSEYHDIRENLGLTSGSHSVGLHYHLMRDLFPQLVRAAAAAGERGDPGELGMLLTDYARSIGIHLDRWRLQHVNLPRNNLGGAGTGIRSLAGSKDAAYVVGRMRDHSLIDAGAPDRAGRATDWEHGALALNEVERRLLEFVAHRTKERFVDVQQRTGYFSGSSDFHPPAERLVAKGNDGG